MAALGREAVQQRGEGVCQAGGGGLGRVHREIHFEAVNFGGGVVAGTVVEFVVEVGGRAGSGFAGGGNGGFDVGQEGG